MSENFCSCDDWNNLKVRHDSIFKWNPPYGWIISWIELTEEDGYTQVNKYGIKIRYCPFCGKVLKSNEV